MVLFAMSIEANGQVLTKMNIKYDVPGRYATKLENPMNYPDVGTVVVDVVVNKQGEVVKKQMREEESTVKNPDQRYYSSFYAGYCTFNEDQNAPDSLKGTITYVYTALTEQQLDSLKITLISDIDTRAKRLERMESANHYELYPTDNMWTFLELDTAFGWVYQVQFSLKGDDYRFKETISYEDLRKGSFLSSDDIIPGRFALYRTQNMYNFLLLDKIDGRIWQVQWSMEENNRGIIRIR